MKTEAKSKMDKQGGERTLGGPEVGINNAWGRQEQPHRARTKNLRKEMMENESDLVPNTSFPRGLLILSCPEGNFSPLPAPSAHVQVRAAFHSPGHSDREGGHVTQTSYPTFLVTVIGPWMGAEPRQAN